MGNPSRKPKTSRGRAWMKLVRRHGVMGASRRWGRHADNPRRSRRRNPLWRSKVSGRFKGRRPGRLLHRISGGMGWRNPPMTNTWFGQPRRHRFAALKGWRGRRRYRNNPRRHRRSIRLRDNPVASIASRIEEAFSQEGIGDFLQGLVGFGGSLAGSQLITTQMIKDANTPLGRIISTLGTGLILSALSGYVSPKAPKRVFFGALLATGYRALSEVVPAEKKATFPLPLLAGMGEDTDFRKVVEAEILKNLRARGVSGYLPPAGLANYRRPAGMDAYLTESEAAGMGAYLTESEAAGLVPSGVGYADEFSGGDAPERF